MRVPQGILLLLPLLQMLLRVHARYAGLLSGALMLPAPCLPRMRYNGQEQGIYML